MKQYRSFFTAALLGLTVLIISGCAAPALYSIDVKHDAARFAPPAYVKAEGKALEAVVAVAEFNDRRKIDDKKIIGRVVEKNGVNILVFPRLVLPAKTVADGVRDYLKKAAYQVADKRLQWDLQEGNIPKEGAKILVGGSIDEMEIVCRRGFPANIYTSGIKLNIVFADVQSGHLVYTRQVEASASREHFSFSEERMGRELSALLGEAIRNVFEDKAVAEKIKELITE